MINVAIVDDDKHFLNLLKNRLLNLDSNLNVLCFTTPYEFIDCLDKIDYVLLDINLPEMNGITLSKQLRNCNISIFFITSYQELMIKAFGKNIEGFILKDNLDNGIRDFLKFVYQQKENNYIEIITNQNKVKIYFDDILFINYSLRDIDFYLTNNKKIRQKNKNLKDIILLLSEDFILINRNTIVNCNHVEKLKNECLFIRNRCFKVSRRKLKKVQMKFIEKEYVGELHIFN